MMLRFLPTLLLLLFLTAAGDGVQAQTPVTVRNYRLYTVRDGMMGNEVVCMLEDSYGYLWLGTSHGLSRFNGTSFQNYRATDSGSPIRTCLQLVQCNDTLLLFGTASGLGVFNLKQNRFENERITDPDLRLGSYSLVVSVLRLPRGELLVSAGNYLYRLDTGLRLLAKKKVATNRFEQVSFGTGVFLDPDSTRMLVGVRFRELNVRTLELSEHRFGGETRPPPGDYSVTAFASLSGKGLMYSYWGNGVFYREDGTGKITTFLVKQGGGGDFISARHLRRDRLDSSVFWAATGSGLLKIHWPSLHAELHTFRQVADEDLDLNFCAQTLQDSNGNLWVATRAGLVRIHRNNQAFSRLDLTGYHRRSKVREAEFNFAAGDGGGRLWIGTYGSGLYEADQNGSAQKQYAPGSSPVGQLVQGVAVHGGQVYVSTYFKGLFRYDEARRGFSPPEFLPSSYRNRPSNFLLFDSLDRCWTSIDGEVGFFDLRTGQQTVVYRKGDSLGIPRTPFYIDQGRGGHMWFALGSWDGRLYDWDPATRRFTQVPIVANGAVRANVVVNRLMTDTEGNLWIATHEYGVLCRKANGQWSQFGEREGLRSASVTALAQSSDGSIWAGTTYGLALLQPGARRFRTFTVEDGLPVNNITGLSIPFRGRSERLLVMMQDDLCWVDPRKLALVPSPVRTYIDRILVDNQTVSGTPRFSYDQRQLLFQFSGVNLDHGEENMYAYRLVGVDERWIENGKSTTVNYSNLPHGSYTFQVRAAGPNGVWSEPASFSFVILPPFWKTLPFYGLCLVAMLLLGYGVYRYQLNRALAMYRVRSRISRDLHDEVGSSLSSIALLNEMAARKSADGAMHRRMSESLSQVQGAISDIVWMINPRNDEMDDIVLRFGEVAAELLEAKGIGYELKCSERVRQLRVPMERRRELFMIYKECLNNIVKYSGATQVTILLDEQQRTMRLRITDNGCGFDPDRIHSGNGLRNMRDRAEALSGTINWTTAPARGTAMELRFPVR